MNPGSSAGQVYAPIWAHTWAAQTAVTRRAGDLLDLALEELHVGGPRLALVLAGEGQHLVGHVEPVGPAGRAHPLRGQEDVDAASGAQIEHRLAGRELGERGGVAAAERRG